MTGPMQVLTAHFKYSPFPRFNYAQEQERSIFLVKYFLFRLLCIFDLRVYHAELVWCVVINKLPNRSDKATFTTITKKLRVR